MSNNQKIAKNTLYLYIRMAVTMVISLISVRIVLRTMGVEEYGVYSSIGGFVATLSFVSNVLTSASQRFFSYELGKGSDGKLKRLFNTVFLIYVGFSVLLVVLAETAGLWFVFNKMTIPADYLSSAHWVYQLAVASFVISLLCNPFLALVISNERMSIYAFVSVSESVLKLLAAIMLIYAQSDLLKLYAILILLITILVNGTYVLYSTNKFHLMANRCGIEFKRIKEILQFSGWTLFGTLANVFNTQGLNILINIFYGPVANAAYAVSSQVSTAINGLSTNFYMAVRPPLIKSYAQNDDSSVYKLLFFSSKVVFVLLFIVIAPILVGTETILSIWLGDVSDYMVGFLRLILVYTLIVNMSNPITTIVQAANKVKIYHGIVDTMTMLTLPVSYFILKKGADADSVFFVSIVVFIIAHCIRLIILRSFFNLKIREYIKSIVIPGMLIVLLVVLFAYVYETVFNPVSIIANVCEIAFVLMVSIAVSLIIMFTNDERRSIRKLIFKR